MWRAHQDNLGLPHGVVILNRLICDYRFNDRFFMEDYVHRFQGLRSGSTWRPLLRLSHRLCRKHVGWEDRALPLNDVAREGERHGGT